MARLPFYWGITATSRLEDIGGKKAVFRQNLAEVNIGFEEANVTAKGQKMQLGMVKLVG